MADVENFDSEAKITSEGVKPCLDGSGDGPETLASQLLLVIGEPFNVEQKDLILERIVTELSTWDIEASKCDINQELNSIGGPFKSIAAGSDGEKIFEHKTSKVLATVLVNPTLATTLAHASSFLSLPSAYKHLLYSGPSLINSGSWLLQDGALTCRDLCDAFRKVTVPECSSEVVFDVALVSDFVDWNEAMLQKVCGKLKVRLSRPSKVLPDESGLIKFSDNISTFLKTSVASERLKSSDIKGLITFDKPTCYIFPAGQGASFLFGVSGFTFLVDGGYSRNTCFWNIVGHLSKLDGILISRLSQDNTFGFSSFFEKKSVDKSGPEVGVVFLNAGDVRHKQPVINGSPPPRATSGLLVSIAEEGRLLAEHLSLTNLSPPMHCLSSLTQNHISLYYKVGVGSLDMYVLNPVQDSKELKDFLASWSKFVDSYKGGAPVSDSVSVACLLVWKPSLHLKESVVRILYPGRISQQKLLDSFDKVKNVSCFQTHTGYEKVKKAVPPSSARPGVTQNPTKQSIVSKPAAGARKTPSSTSLEHKSNDGKKPMVEVKKPAPATTAPQKEPVKKLAPSHRTVAAPTQKSPTKTPKQAGQKEPKSIKSGPPGSEKKPEVKAPVAASVVDPVVAATVDPVVSAAVDPLVSANVDPVVSATVDPVVAGEAEKIELELKEKELKEETKEVEEEKDVVSPLSGNEESEIKHEVDAATNEAGDASFEPEKEWGEPAGLPSPMKNTEEIPADQPSRKGDGGKSPDKPKKIPVGSGGDKVPHAPMKRPTTAPEKLNTTIKEDPNRSMSAAKKPSSIIKSATGRPAEVKKPLKPVQGFYVDLTYIPDQSDLEFFRRVRARYYVLSSANPDNSILNGLLDAKATWDETDQWEVNVVLTHESPVLCQWMQQNSDRLISANVKVTPPASLCTIELEDRDSTCAAYRLQL